MARRYLLPFCLLIATLSFAATTREELTVHFPKDEHTLTPASMAELDAFLAVLTIRGDYVFTVHGHTDSDGSQQYNDALSQARAEAVQRYLSDKGVDPSRIRIQRSGERDPLAANTHEPGMALNRRVQLTFTRHSYADTEELRRSLMEGSVQHFDLDPTKDHVVVGTAGTQLTFQAHAFVDATGRPATGTVALELTEALGLQAIIAHQLSTLSGSRMLETGGMLKVRATDAAGNELRLKATTPMHVALPATTREEGMELFLSTDGDDWTTTAQPLPVTTTTTWREPPYPKAPSIPYRWPHYREDQNGKPIKPVEPALPREPVAPREESYQRKRPWWAFLFPTRAKERSAFNYAQALQKYAIQRTRYERKLAAYNVECANYPERLQRYDQRRAAWDALKMEEYETWRAAVYEPARKRYDEVMAPLRARYDSLRANYHLVRAASMQRYVQQADSLGTADIGGLNAYVFTTSHLGWINCDRFYNVPEEQKYQAVAKADQQSDAQVFLVFDRIRSMMRMQQDGNRRYSSPSIARTEPATLFAYTVIDGQAHVCMRPITPSADTEIRFEPSSMEEIGALLRSLGSRGS